MHSYQPPVDKLLTYGVSKPVDAPDWPNYLEFGIGSEHIPDLIRMVTDKELHKADLESPEAWAPIHAWRALGQLRTAAAIEPLLSVSKELLSAEMIWEWALEELPEVYGVSGPVAIPPLTAYIADESHDVDARANAMTGLAKVASMYPDTRAECVAVLMRQLELFATNDPEMNAYLISTLLSMKAQEALPVMKSAFDAECVDESIVSWEDVEIDLGMKPPPEPRFKNMDDLVKSMIQSSSPSSEEEIAPDIPFPSSEEIAAPRIPSFSSTNYPNRSVSSKVNKAKNKMAKQSRKKNRKKR